jgi:hypothetical protein
MQTGNLFFKKAMVFLTTASLMLLPACGQNMRNEEPRQQQLQVEQEQQKPPEQLIGIEKSIEAVIKSLDGPAAGTQQEEKGQGTKNPEQGNQNQEQQGQDKQEKIQQDQNQQGQAQQGQGQQQASTRQMSPWTEIDPLTSNLHYQWNNYMPEALKSGAGQSLTDNFGNALNSMTDAVVSRNKTSALLAASRLYAFIPDFYSLYRGGVTNEIKRIRYYTRNAMLNAMTANWAQADNDISSLKSSWPVLKGTMNREQQADSNKLEFSIRELEKVIKERNQPLADIKGKVAMANIDALEKSLEKEADTRGREQQGGGQ